jgi:lactate racemase
MKRVDLLYDDSGLSLDLPDRALVLRGQDPPPIPDPEAEVARVLSEPTGAAPLAELVRNRRPREVAITISDITRPVPNRILLGPVLRTLNEAGVADDQVVIVVGTGMHRPSTRAELVQMLGEELLGRLEVISHTSDDPATLVRVSDDPPVSVNRRFARADLRLVTGLIEPHFMAGFSGGRKGIIPALADLTTVRRFHSFETLANPLADNGVLAGNPCHQIALDLARRVGADLLLNVAINRARQVCGVFGGDLELAHARGCEQVAKFTRAEVAAEADLVITCGGGAPLDRTFYQTVKGMVCALPALCPDGTLLQVSGCAEGIGSPAYTELMRRWGTDWRGFVADRLAHPGETLLDQWELQMQCKVLERLGQQRLCFASDGIPTGEQAGLAVTPLPGPGDARARTQRFVDSFIANNPRARVAVIPEGPYTLL